MSEIQIKTFLNVLAVASFLGLMTYLLTSEKQKEMSSATLVQGRKTIITQDMNGNFVTNGTIDGVGSSMLIDTGASTLVITESLAQKIGLLKRGRVAVNTANGTSEGYLTVVKEIKIGNLLGKNINAVVVPNMDIPHVLIGMSFLKTINFEKNGRQLILLPGS